MNKGNELIAELMGYKLVSCYNGRAFEGPYLNSVDDIFELHGRLFREKDSYYKWNSSWDWLMPVIKKLFSFDETDIGAYEAFNNDYLNQIRESLKEVDINVTYQLVVETINQIKNYQK